MKARALFLDRDGIFNEVVFRDNSIHSPRHWEEVKHFDLTGIVEFKKLGFKLIMVTNQPDIERKIVSDAFLKELHQYYSQKYELDAIYMCPFASNDHPDKKPNPGMFLSAAKDWNLDLTQSFHLGDTERDVIAAARCGIKSIIWTRNYNKELKADHRITTLIELRALLE